jgi:hypothetical protein
MYWSIYLLIASIKYSTLVETDPRQCYGKLLILAQQTGYCYQLMVEAPIDLKRKNTTKFLKFDHISFKNTMLSQHLHNNYFKKDQKIKYILEASAPQKFEVPQFTVNCGWQIYCASALSAREHTTDRNLDHFMRLKKLRFPVCQQIVVLQIAVVRTPPLFCVELPRHSENLKIDLNI